MTAVHLKITYEDGLPSPELATLEGINSVLEQYGLDPLEENALKPLFVA